MKIGFIHSTTAKDFATPSVFADEIKGLNLINRSILPPKNAGIYFG